MIEWLNFLVLVLSSMLMLHYYVKSVGPASLEQKIGPAAWRMCKRYRIIASILEGIIVVNYIIYFFYPLPLSILLTFAWDYWVTVAIGFAVSIPGMIVMFMGIRDAGAETLTPKKEHTMYGGIYEKMRHPQAVGELPIWWLAAFILNSPFLALYSFVFIPIFYLMTLAEERDLVIRYGQDYLVYRQRVGYFPRLRKK